MTANEFNALCLAYYIPPALALENENVREALKQRDTERLKEILENEF